MGEWELVAVEGKVDAIWECRAGRMAILIRQISIFRQASPTAPHTPYHEEYRKAGTLLIASPYWRSGRSFLHSLINLFQ